MATIRKHEIAIRWHLSAGRIYRLTSAIARKGQGQALRCVHICTEQVHCVYVNHDRLWGCKSALRELELAMDTVPSNTAPAQHVLHRRHLSTQHASSACATPWTHARKPHHTHAHTYSFKSSERVTEWVEFYYAPPDKVQVILEPTANSINQSVNF